MFTLRVNENECITMVEEIVAGQYSLRRYENNKYHLSEHDGTGPIKIHLGKNARLHWIQYQNLPDSISRTAEYHVTQDSHSTFTAGFFATGGKVVKESTHITQSGEHAESLVYGLSLPTRDGQSISHQVQIDHQAPHGNSRMLYKGILDKKSISTFHGKVVVHKLAEKINAAQANHHLLLCAGAEAKSQPELEIDAEDVKCSHGSTVGQLDEDALFYLQARGIPLHDAKKLLTDAFAAEIFSTVPDATIRQWLLEKVYRL